MPKYGWDPSVAVAPDHRVYVAYMLYRHSHVHPMVAISHDHGATFARVSRPASPVRNNWGDRDFIAVGPTGTVYLTWDFGPSLSPKSRHGNIVIQKSSDGGRTWSPITVVSPGFPDHGGGVAAPLLVEPGGRIDVAFWVWSGGALAPYALPPGHIYFTSSADGGRTWSKPVGIRPGAGRIGLFVTWIDVALSIDAAGNLYATWDTQSPGGDIGWLSYSTDHGRTWSPARRVTPDHDKAEHIMAVTSGPPGVAYVGWLTGGPFFAPRRGGFRSTCECSRSAAGGCQRQSGCPAGPGTAMSGRATRSASPCCQRKGMPPRRSSSAGAARSAARTRRFSLRQSRNSRPPNSPARRRAISHLFRIGA